MRKIEESDFLGLDLKDLGLKRWALCPLGILQQAKIFDRHVLFEISFLIEIVFPLLLFVLLSAP